MKICLTKNKCYTITFEDDNLFIVFHKNVKIELSEQEAIEILKDGIKLLMEMELLILIIEN